MRIVKCKVTGEKGYDYNFFKAPDGRYYKTKSVYLESSNNINIVHDGSVYHTVEASEENRLDIISNIYYGTPSLYWAIAMANNIIDPMIVVKGTVLRIPSYESLFVTGGPLIRRG